MNSSIFIVIDDLINLTSIHFRRKDSAHLKSFSITDSNIKVSIPLLKLESYPFYEFFKVVCIRCTDLVLFSKSKCLYYLSNAKVAFIIFNLSILNSSPFFFKNCNITRFSVPSNSILNFLSLT